MHSPISGTDVSMGSVLLSAINTTAYFNGLFGLGITVGSFNGKAIDPPLVQAVKSSGLIPSYTYGYTAGAHYSKCPTCLMCLYYLYGSNLASENAPSSLTLGGVDEARFEDHQVRFVLAKDNDLPQILVRGIELQEEASADDEEANEELSPEDGVSRTNISDWGNSFTAVVDTTTPYLWLPKKACDAIADSLDLQYNKSFDLYTMSNDRYREYRASDNASFTFSLSSIDNRDDFGDPLGTSGVVNITVPLKAFVAELSYPFMDGDLIGYGDPSIPYFTLRRSPDDSTYILGRAFLQESYIITKYDERAFSVHQARFVDDVVKDAEIESVKQASGSPYPAPATAGRQGLDTGQVAGITVGVVTSCCLAIVAWLWLRRRKNKRCQSLTDSVDGDKHIDSPGASTPPVTPLAKLWCRWRRLPKSADQQVPTIVSRGPAEAPDCEIYELPAPVPPAELNGLEDDEGLTGDTRFGLEGHENLTEYEQSRRKLDHQLQGPVPAYSPPLDGTIISEEKPSEDIERTLEPQIVSHAAPGLLAGGQTGPQTNSSTSSMSSPISPRTDSNGEPINLVSPMDATAPIFPGFNLHGSQPGSVSPLNSSSEEQSSDADSASQSNPKLTARPASVTVPSVTIPPPIQRTPIDPSKVVYMGEIPEDMLLPRRRSLPRINMESVVPSGNPAQHDEAETLGSDYTEEQERLAALAKKAGLAATSQSAERPEPHMQIQRSSSNQAEPDTPQSLQRIDPGAELVHVPQLAEKRYSWENSL